MSSKFHVQLSANDLNTFRSKQSLFLCEEILNKILDNLANLVIFKNENIKKRIRGYKMILHRQFSGRGRCFLKNNTESKHIISDYFVVVTTINASQEMEIIQLDKHSNYSTVHPFLLLQLMTSMVTNNLDSLHQISCDKKVTTCFVKESNINNDVFLQYITHKVTQVLNPCFINLQPRLESVAINFKINSDKLKNKQNPDATPERNEQYNTKSSRFKNLG